MQSYLKYEETDIDKYLTGEFQTRFDTNLLNKICDTNLNFYRYENDISNNYEVTRKFFILSVKKLNANSINDAKTKNTMSLNYFNADNRIAINDIGAKCPYWARTFSRSTYCMVGYNGVITSTVGTVAKYSIRPAFTIPNNTKISKIYDKTLNQNIYIFDI